MYEFRIVERDIGKQYQNDWGYFQPVTIFVHQVRESIQRGGTDFFGRGFNAHCGWSEWQDIPVYKLGEYDD